jgi:hypothetical protein
VNVTSWVLVALVVLALAMCVWAYFTGGQGPEWRQEMVRQRPPAHSRRNRGQTTQRLRPPAPDWLPPMERPGGEAQPLPPPEDLPWPARRG